MARHLAEHPVVGEERHDDELGEERRLHPLEQPVRRLPARFRLAQLDRPHEPEAAHVLHDVVALDERARALQQQLAHPRGAVGEGCRVELVQRRQAGDHREVVRLERRAVAQRVLERVEDGVEHLGPEERGPDGHVAARQRLRQREDVRLEPPVLEREELAGAPEARLHLVEAEERAVAAAQLLRAFQVARREAGGRRGRRPARRRRARRLLRGEPRRARRGRRTARARSRAASGWNRSEKAGSPAAESAPSVRPWKPCSTETTRVRPVAARPILIAASIASVPELEKSTRPRLAGARLSSSSARIAPSGLTPSASLPGVSSSSASTSAARTRGLLRPTLYIPKPPSQSR